MKTKRDNFRIKLANIKFYTSIEYEKTVSVFEKENQMRIHKIIKDITEEIECKAFLDLGCGTGNILKIASPYFKECYGIDISKENLAQSNFLVIE